MKIYFTLVFVLFLFVLFFAYQTFKPIKKVYPNDVLKIENTVNTVYLGNGGDIYIKLKNDSHNYYINQAIQKGFFIEKLKSLIQDNRVSLYHINRWTPFTSDNIFPHISKLTLADSIIFDEIIYTK